MELNINPNLTATQGQALKYLLDDKTNDILFGGAAGGGKSYIGCSFLILMCIKYAGTRYLMGRSKLDNLKKTTLNTFFEICQQWNIISGKHFNFNAGSNIITFYNGSEIMLKDLFHYPADPNYDSLGSLEITGAFIDECNQITEKAKNIVNSRIRYKLDQFGLIPKLFLTCNPSKNWVYTSYYRKAREGKMEPHKKFIQSLVDDNPHVSIHYKGQLEKLDEMSKQRLLFGNWEYNAGEDNLCEYDAIINLFNQEGVGGEKYITCDVARFGTDKTIILYWEGLSVKQIISFDKSSVTEVSSEIKRLQQSEGVNLRNIIVDSDGVGGGVQDILNCKGFQNNGRPIKKENYQNIKTQCYYKLADMINKGQIGIETNNITQKNMIIEELEQIRSKDMDKDSKLQIIAKETVRAIIGRSPDYADAIMMRMYYEVDKNFGRYFVQ
tara:strand:+ start:2613 stop:3929 length:1317 start_codon:yes stop_codon:yes gene_type:complete